MKVPFHSLRVLGKVYSVELSEDMDDKYGYCNHKKQVIEYAEQHHDQLRDTFIHEAMHAIDYGMATGLKEEQVHALACGLYSLLKDNPGFAKWLLEEPHAL